MKTLVKINLKQNIDKYIDKCEGLILGMELFSVGFRETFSIEEIEEIVKKYPEKDIFISLNKSIFNNELESLNKILIELDNLKVKGILFYDLSILYMKKKNNLKIDLVWNQTHLVTNYNTCNYYYGNGVKYGFLSGEITKDEILEINKNSSMDFLLTIVAHQTMSFTRRKLLTNYYTSIGKKYDGEEKKISEKEREYLIMESNDGTEIKTGEIFNGIEILPELLNNNLSYVVVEEASIDSDIISKLLTIINNVISNTNVDSNIIDSYSLIGNNTSFLFKKTIFKVKKESKEI